MRPAELRKAPAKPTRGVTTAFHPASTVGGSGPTVSVGKESPERKASNRKPMLAAKAWVVAMCASAKALSVIG